MNNGIAPILLTTFRRTRRRRDGLMIVAALVCLLVITSIVCSMLKGTLRARRELHAERDRRQTELLLEAGADRTAARLATELDFRGDTWELPATAILGQGAGRVTTEVSTSADNQPRQVRVIAEYPLGRDLQIRRSRTFPIASSKTQKEE